MTAGFLIDRDYYVPNQQRWAAGEPTLGWKASLVGEGSGERTTYRVRTYRCEKCGALESFAVDPE
ncbi:MAG TPA: hypothetical protein VFX05_02810 [Casimicrobiaceae bacterium]|nr:hypothetical protein [Casimicrobiaceae bacterium]